MLVQRWHVVMLLMQEVALVAVAVELGVDVLLNWMVHAGVAKLRWSLWNMECYDA